MKTCNLVQLQKTIFEMQSRSLKEKAALCIQMKNSFPAFVLANFQVNDAIFYGLSNPEFNSQNFVNNICENVVNENKKLVIVESSLENPKKLPLRFYYSENQGFLQIYWEFKGSD